MKTRWILAAGSIAASLSVLGLVGACAAEATDFADGPDAGASSLPAPEAGGDDAAPDGSGSPCADCEYFPSECQADSLCENGPFAADTAGGPFDVRTQVNCIRGRSATDIWAAGSGGALAHFDGTSWTRSDIGAPATLRFVWLREGQEAAFGELHQLYLRGFETTTDAGTSPDRWTAQSVPRPPDYGVGGPFDSDPRQFESAWAPPGSEWLWAVTRTSYSPQGLWGLHLSGSGMVELRAVETGTCCGAMTGIYGVSADDLWAVGHSGTAVRVFAAESDAPKVTVFNSQTWNALYAVWVTSESEAWAVGAAGTIRHYRGDPLLWDVVRDVPTTENLNAVWGTSSNDVWAVGDDAVVLHYDGTAWTRVKIAGLGARRPNLRTVWMAAPSHVWVAGDGVVLSLGGQP